MQPDERALRADLARPEFLLAEIEGRWRLMSLDWPHAVITVTAADNTAVGLRFNCSGFPNAVTAQPWDVDAKRPLPPALWPKSHGGRVSAVFNPGWKHGTALYLPCDREAIVGHDAWRSQMPSKIWRPSEGIVQYLELVHALLNSRDYKRTAAA